MTHAIDQRLAELGIALPDAPAAAANYVPFLQVGNLVHVSAPALPFGSAVEIEGVFELETGSIEDLTLGQVP